MAKLGLTLQRQNALLRLRWKPRAQNQKADDLTNGRFDAFDPAKRVKVSLQKGDWIILLELLEAGRGWTAERERLKRMRAEEGEGGSRKRLGEASRLIEGWNAKTPRQHPGDGSA